MSQIIAMKLCIKEEVFFYALLPHPSFYKAKPITTKDLNKTFFETREHCLDARIKRMERDLKLEKEFKERKI